MPRKRKGRIYWRNGRAWGDFRDLGGGREPLVPDGDRYATEDADVATKLAADRVGELRGRGRSRALDGTDRHATLHDFAASHLVKKAKAENLTETHLEELERRLRTAIKFFGAGREVHTIDVADVQTYLEWLLEQPNGRGGTYSSGTARHYLNALSNLFRRAQADKVVRPGHNPVRALMDKPAVKSEEAEWLEVPEAALLLESARTWEPDPRASDANPEIHAIIAAMLLTGGRPAEVLGLAVRDISFDRQTATFRPHPWRGLKTKNARRVVPLFPQLEEILREHVFGGVAPRAEGLLFPSPRTGEMVHDIRKALDAIAERAGWEKGEVRPYAFRHTYCAARLQTLDGGAPISPYTVARELGHGGRALVDRVYGHLGTVRHRADVVEYRIDQHKEQLAERLAALRAGQPRRCRGTTSAGEPCRIQASISEDGFCLWHDPARKEEAKRARPHARR